MDFANEEGSIDSLSMLFLSGRIRDAWRGFEEGAAIASELYPPTMGAMAILARAGERSNEAETDLLRIAHRRAGSFGAIASLYSQGLDGRAQKLIEEIAEQELAVKPLSGGLELLEGRDYAALCSEHRRLLRPSELDTYVFINYAPEHWRLREEYLTRMGLGVLAPDDGATMAFVSRQGITKQELAGPPASMTAMQLTSESRLLLIDGDAQQFLEEYFAECDYTAITATSREAHPYFGLRHQAERLGAASKHLLPF